MITTFNAMPPTCSLPSMPAADYRADARGLGAVLGLQHGAQARLQPGPVARLPLARRLRRVRRRADARACATPSTTGSPGIAAPSCPTTPTCWRGPQAELPDRPTRRADVRLEPTSCAPASTPRSSSAVPAMAEVVPTLSPAQLASIEKRYAKNERGVPRRLPAARPGEAPARPRSSATIERAEMLYGRLDDAQRELRRAHGRRLAVRRRASARRARGAASRTCWRSLRRLPPKRAGPARGARPRSRAYVAAHRSARRASPTGATRSGWSTTTARSPRDLHNRTTRRAAAARRRRSSRAGRTTCARSPATAPS